MSKYILYMPGFKTCDIIKELGLPVIQFSHLLANLQCNLFFSNSLGLVNTQLLQLYSKMDYYVYVLLMVLRFWGKRESFVGESQMISSYAFSWLVIFYLQRKNLVPTVEKLAQLSDKPVESEGWDCSFTEDIESIPVGTKDKSFPELMSGFFEFYSKFDFSSNVICPRDGSVRLKREFLAKAGDKLDFQMTELSVQDVFVLTHNTTASVSMETINKFHSMCAKQFIVWQDMIKNRKVYLNLLFCDTLPQEANPSASKIPVSKIPVSKPLYINISLESHYDIDKVCNFFLDIFKRVFLFQCDILNTSPEFKFDNKSCTITKVAENPCKKQKPSELLEKFLLEVKCQVCHQIWYKRKHFIRTKPTAPKGLQRLDYEENISREMAQKKSKHEGPLYDLNSTFTLWKERNELRVLFIPNSTQNDLLFTVMPFLKKYVLTLAETSLKAYLTSK